MAPGVGKTYTMLGEGARRAERGTDVVVAFVEDHGRPHTREMVEGLEVVPRHRIEHRGATFEEMDVDAVLARRPQVALVDELAHTNVPGSRNAKRWQDVAELVAAGIDVITTVNIQHLESVNDVVERITGVPQRETVPDAVVRAADQVELVDMTAEALRRRLAHGNVYAPEKIDAALGNYFRPGNLNALREIALLWTADRVDDALQVYRSQHDIDRTWEARERVVVALTGGPEGDTLIRRAARIAARGRGELQAVHVGRSDGLRGASSTHLTRQQLLVESLGGTFHQVLGDDVPQALLAFARAAQATQLVLGDSRRGMARRRLTGPGIGADVIARSGDIDVHIVTHEQSGRGARRPAAPASLSRTAPAPGVRRRRPAAPRRDRGPRALPRRAQPRQRRARAHPDRGRRRPRRRPRPRSARGSGGDPAAQLPAHAAALHPGGHRRQRRRRAGGVPARRGGHQLRGRPRGTADPGGGPRRHRVARPGEPRELVGRRAARPPGSRRCSPPSGSRSGWPAPGCGAAASGRRRVAAGRGVARARPTTGRARPGVGRQRGRGRRPRADPRRRRARRRGPPTRRPPSPSSWPPGWTGSGWSRPRPRPHPWRRPTGCGPRCWPRSVTTCGPPWPRPRRRSPACAATTSTWPPRTRRSCWPPPTSPSTCSPAWSTTCST